MDMCLGTGMCMVIGMVIGITICVCVCICVVVCVYVNDKAYGHFCDYGSTAISKKVVVVNSRYWNREELWVQAAQIIYYCYHRLCIVLECRFIITPQPYSNSLRSRVITH